MKNNSAMDEAVFIRRRSKNEMRVAVLLASAFAICTFALNSALALRLESLGVFQEYNVLFDADPITQIESLSHGSNPYGRNFSHPNLANYFNPPVRILARIVTLSGLTDLGEREIRHIIGLLVVPLATGLRSLIVFGIFYALGFSLVQVSLLTTLGIVSFSQLIFGSIPDHFALSGLALALAHLLVIDLWWHGGRIRWWAWIMVGAVATGITITNIIMIGLLLGVPLVLYRRELIGPIIHTAAMMLAITAVTVVSAFALNMISGYEQKQSLSKMKKWTKRFVREDPLQNLVHFPAAVANTLAPPEPRLVDNRIGIRHKDKVDYQFSLEKTAGIFSTENFLGFILLLLLLVGSVICLQSPSVLRPLAIASLAVLAFNWSLHAVWGVEYFLYSQHWQISVLVLLAGTLAVGERFRGVVMLAFGVIVGSVALNNAIRINDMMSIIASSAQ